MTLIKRYDLRNESADGLLTLLKNRSQLDIAEVNDIVRGVIDDIQKKGDSALLQYTEKFDKVKLTAQTMKVSEAEILAAFDVVDSELKGTIEKAIENITAFHEKQKTNSWFDVKPDGTTLGMIVRALDSVGIYVPGGTAPLISTVLMNVIPAKVAGVERIVMATPPASNGEIPPAILVAAKLAGATEIYKMGGAQAIATLAFGTETITKVDKIFGPGNIFVATAKRMVFGYCGIDSFAGPSEITIVADKTANPKFLAADLLSQAEHDKLASAILITDSEEIAREVESELASQVALLPRKEIAEISLSSFGAIVCVENLENAVDVVNMIAPEHLELSVDKPFELVGRVRHAGAIFMGHYSPESLGDYFAGPNHVLPTSGTARFFSPLNVGDFVKKSSLISYSEAAFQKVADDVERFAKAESLDAHARAITVRKRK